MGTTLHRQRLRLSVLAALLLASRSHADDLFSCTPNVQGHAYDLSELGKLVSVSSVASTPPSRTTTTYTLSLCAPIPVREDAPAEDQCPPGTRACMIVTNDKDPHATRVISVIPLAMEANEHRLDPSLSLLDSSKSQQPLLIKLHGGQYGEQAQQLELELLCDPDTANSEPVIDAYTPSNGTLTMSWTSKFACATHSPSGDTPQTGEPSNNQGRGFFGWFFLVLFLGFIAYFAIGMWHNHFTYGETGWRMVPHREAWADLPYVVRDVFRRGDRGSGYTVLS
ncbi:uncharacterized protein L969DRAFT_237133 [Mixia osmundae IAM 14324]|uniref:Autophagy-related protein 27 n=1 Tax=Mixia osmundae (strain CBS 9802 / IAM 14324 / JCM 22182 / KY 12970) TaxID=764103 RepID=G7E2H8_MIXOS|nr:uncharacterized protein L969DRAFT_237133 [Mixia osmundae IAM 14324]KEI36910.1 hypothetical protein L969DRAFT_237133 [Mixia osmundae IAM 14324]GAA97038.1 hypothetical protein E5Q_03713 [Mixia osmundae IAM 14324]